MNRMTLMAAVAALAISGSAMAQMTTTEQNAMPNGGMRTTTRVETPGGSASSTRIDRPDGSTRVIERQTDAMGNTSVDRHDQNMDHRDGGMDMRDHDHMDRHDGMDRHDRMDGHDRMNGHGRKVCKTVWRHGMRHRNCWMAHRRW